MKQRADENQPLVTNNRQRSAMNGKLERSEDAEDERSEMEDDEQEADKNENNKRGIKIVHV